MRRVKAGRPPLIVTGLLVAGGCSLDTFGIEPGPKDTTATSTDSSTTATATTNGSTSEGTGMVADGTIAHVAVGHAFTCIIRRDGALFCWGYGGTGNLGLELTPIALGDDELPSTLGPVDIGDAARQVSAGGYHTCSARNDGALYCWGGGSSGQLGLSMGVVSTTTPAAGGPVDIGGNAEAVALGYEHTCALRDTGEVLCWGNNVDGRLGYGDLLNVGLDETPAVKGPVAVGGSVRQIVAGRQHTCAVRDDDTVVCWGGNAWGQLGYGHKSPMSSPGPALELGGGVMKMTAGGYHNCALLTTRHIVCWGRNDVAQLGYGLVGNVGDNEPPNGAGAVDVGGPVLDISGGQYHTCALLDGGAVTCWGQNAAGELGYGHTQDLSGQAPVAIGPIDLGGAAVEIAAGTDHTCARLESDQLRCWGKNLYGALGYGSIGPYSAVCGGIDTFSCDPHPADDDDRACCIGDDETPASAGVVPGF